MRYHINYDGKILPCRAKIKNCPYGPGRHSDTYEDLYYKYQDTYNNVNPSPTFLERTRAGEPLHGLQDIDSEISTSDSPIELICSSLKEAIKYAGAGSLTKDEQDTRAHAVALTRDYILSGTSAPSNLPKAIREEGEALAAKVHGIRSIIDTTKMAEITNNHWLDYKESIPELRRIEIKRAAGFQFTPDQKVRYQKALRSDFDHWANILNTRKLIATPMINTNDDNKLEETLNKMSNEELLSVYDSCTLSDEEVVSRIQTTNNFKFEEIPQLSEGANKNLSNWFEAARKAQKRYIIGSARRTLVALYTTNILYKRGVKTGDFVYTVNEKLKL